MEAMLGALLATVVGYIWHTKATSVDNSISRLNTNIEQLVQYMGAMMKQRQEPTIIKQDAPDVVNTGEPMAGFHGTDEET